MRNIEMARMLASLALVTVILLSASCQQMGIEPVAIAAEDICSFCRMAISEKQYASELVTRDGDALKFDDIGCMVNYLGEKKQKEEIAAMFVTDFESRAWIRAEDAHYVKTEKLKTPMGGGVIAFKDDSAARKYAATVEGSIARFEEVMKMKN
jgi:copper chaperone NosL